MITLNVDFNEHDQRGFLRARTPASGLIIDQEVNVLDQDGALSGFGRVAEVRGFLCFVEVDWETVVDLTDLSPHDTSEDPR